MRLIDADKLLDTITTLEGALMQCGVSGITVNDEDYCSYGERIEE